MISSKPYLFPIEENRKSTIIVSATILVIVLVLWVLGKAENYYLYMLGAPMALTLFIELIIKAPRMKVMEEEGHLVIEIQKQRIYLIKDHSLRLFKGIHSFSISSPNFEGVIKKKHLSESSRKVLENYNSNAS